LTMAPSLDTRKLFLQLLRTLEIDVVCDVGSMDGRDALRFRRRLSRADIIALEPHPANYRRMQEEGSIASAGIELVPAAAAHFDGEAPFHLVPAPPGPEQRGRRGMSSLLRRGDSRFTGSSTVTQVLRLDGLLGARARGRKLALWMDCEGMAFEALTGAVGIAPSLRLLHIEVEIEPCIGATQRLYPEVAELLRSWGFLELATNRAPDQNQFDVVYVRGDLNATTRWRVAGWVLGLRLHRRLMEGIAAMRRGLARRARRPAHP